MTLAKCSICKKEKVSFILENDDICTDCWKNGYLPASANKGIYEEDKN